MYPENQMPYHAWQSILDPPPSWEPALAAGSMRPPTLPHTISDGTAADSGIGPMADVAAAVSGVDSGAAAVPTTDVRRGLQAVEELREVLIRLG